MLKGIDYIFLRIYFLKRAFLRAVTTLHVTFVNSKHKSLYIYNVKFFFNINSLER